LAPFNLTMTGIAASFAGTRHPAALRRIASAD
jgi:hypothetical protein